MDAVRWNTDQARGCQVRQAQENMDKILSARSMIRMRYLERSVLRRLRILWFAILLRQRRRCSSGGVLPACTPDRSLLVFFRRRALSHGTYACNTRPVSSGAPCCSPFSTASDPARAQPPWEHCGSEYHPGFSTLVASILSFISTHNTDSIAPVSGLPDRPGRCRWVLRGMVWSWE